MTQQRELFCVRDAGAFFKVGGSVGVFGGQDDIAGFIALFELFNGEPDGGIAIRFVVGKGDLECTKFHTVFPYVDCFFSVFRITLPRTPEKSRTEKDLFGKNVFSGLQNRFS